MLKRLGLMGVLGGALLLSSCGFQVTSAGTISKVVGAAPVAAPVLVPTPAAEVPTQAPVPAVPVAPAPRSTAALSQQIDTVAATYGAEVSVTLVELGGPQPLTWSVNGDRSFTAASTYKLPLLMMTAEAIAAGRLHASDQVCYTEADYEDGWFDDYADGSCFAVSDLAVRVGHYSDNTAAHMLVDALGGANAFTAYATAHGAKESQFYDPNTTTSNDLARLLVSLHSGGAGGAATQKFVYPLLTNTAFEQGIPAGTGSGATVVHKIGDIDTTLNDAALVTGGPKGDYVLVIMSDGPGAGPGWPLLASISQSVWKFEAARS